MWPAGCTHRAGGLSGTRHSHSAGPLRSSDGLMIWKLFYEYCRLKLRNALISLVTKILMLRKNTNKTKKTNVKLEMLLGTHSFMFPSSVSRHFVVHMEPPWKWVSMYLPSSCHMPFELKPGAASRRGSPGRPRPGPCLPPATVLRGTGQEHA